MDSLATGSVEKRLEAAAEDHLYASCEELADGRQSGSGEGSADSRQSGSCDGSADGRQSGSCEGSADDRQNGSGEGLADGHLNDSGDSSSDSQLNGSCDSSADDRQNASCEEETASHLSDSCDTAAKDRVDAGEADAVTQKEQERLLKRRQLKEEHARELARMVEEAKDVRRYECSIREEFPASGLTAFMARRRGRSHVAKGGPCQDYCLTSGGDRVVILTVADGVGSCPKSDEGARLACEVTAATVKAAAQHCSSERELVDVLCGLKFREKLVKRWLAAVIALIGADKTANSEAGNEQIRQYSSTLMWVVVTDEWYVAGNIGDGQILFFNDADAVKVREHPRKMSSRVRALVHERCYLEDFQVARFHRADFSGVLMTTDGMYDVLGAGLHLHRYALQLKKRFLDSGRPLQPFCYEEPGEEMKDISMAMTMDDCTVVLALDSRQTAAEVYDDRRMADVLSEQAMMLKKSGETSLYLLRNGSEFLQMAASPAAECTFSLPALENAFVQRPLRSLDKGMRRYNLYEDTNAPTLQLLYGSGLFRETREGNSLIIPVFRRLLDLERELEQQGLALTDAAAFLICVERAEGQDDRQDGARNTGDRQDDTQGAADRSMQSAGDRQEGARSGFRLVMKREAVARLLPERTAQAADGQKTRPARKPLFWQYFAAMIGTLTCRGRTFQETARPVYSCGYMMMGNMIRRMAPGEEEIPLMRLKQDAKGGLIAMNAGESAWRLAGGETVLPGEGTALFDGLRFSIEGQDSEAQEYVYRSREAL